VLALAVRAVSGWMSGQVSTHASPRIHSILMLWCQQLSFSIRQPGGPLQIDARLSKPQRSSFSSESCRTTMQHSTLD